MNPAIIGHRDASDTLAAHTPGVWGSSAAGRDASPCWGRVASQHLEAPQQAEEDRMVAANSTVNEPDATIPRVASESFPYPGTD
ncbi:MAG: hypothetical protein DK306_002228 [Chloroflexi bacterium]|nr:MAG: hypothetical protein DK306_002228 [Chloroflexota bacterium]